MKKKLIITNSILASILVLLYLTVLLLKWKTDISLKETTPIALTADLFEQATNSQEATTLQSSTGESIEMTQPASENFSVFIEETIAATETTWQTKYPESVHEDNITENTEKYETEPTQAETSGDVYQTEENELPPI